MIEYIVIIALIGFIILQRMQSRQNYINGAIEALKTMSEEFRRVMIHITIEKINDEYFCHDIKGNFIAQSDTVEVLLEDLSMRKSVYILYKDKKVADEQIKPI